MNELQFIRLPVKINDADDDYDDYDEGQTLGLVSSGCSIQGFR